MINDHIVGLLRCPFCGGKLGLHAVLEEVRNTVEDGLLHCPDCRFDYPIVAGIAILFGPHDTVDVKEETTARTIFQGPRVGDLVALLRGRELTRALSLLLTPASDKGHLFPPLHVADDEPDSIEHLLSPHGRPPHHPPHDSGSQAKPVRLARRGIRSMLLPTAKRRLAQFLRAHESALSALDVIQLYYEAFSRVEMFNYFAFRFGQPRHLAALSLISRFQGTSGPLLDLACGMGHLTFHLTETFPGRLVFALDRDFFRLYVGRHYVAPTACYVCAPADQPLPLAPSVFSGVVCSDAFHYLRYRALTVREMTRVLDPAGVLILCRVGNWEVEPREGYELTIESYERLLAGTNHVLLGEDDLVTRYLDRRGPDLRTEAPRDVLRRQKWLSIVAEKDLALHRPIQFQEWPHARGRLQLNPMYSATPAPDGGFTLTFHFPSEWYALENERYARYAAPECEVSPSDLQYLSAGERSPRIDDLVGQFVVLGLPDTYVHAARGDYSQITASV